MRRIILYSIYFFLFTIINLVSQEKPDDYGSLFIRAVNSPSEVEQKDIISKIFSQSALEEVGMDRLHSFIKRMHSDYAPLSYPEKDCQLNLK